MRGLIYLVLFPLTLLGCLQLGSVPLSAESLLSLFAENNTGTEQLILQLRLPRVICALLIGAALGLAGLLLQSRSGNALADPGVLGINQGAALAAVTLMVSLPAADPDLIPLAGLAGALAVTLLLWWMGLRCQPVALLLIGIALASLLAALTGLLLLLGDQQRLTTVLIWLSGSLAGASWDSVQLLTLGLLILLPPTLLLCFNADPWLLDPLSRQMLGAEPRWQSTLALLLVALLSALAVTVAGAISFIGLLAPHLARLLHGPLPSRLALPSMLIGALLCLLADSLGRSLFAPLQLPVGLVLAVIGAPTFLILLISRNRLSIASKTLSTTSRKEEGTPA